MHKRVRWGCCAALLVAGAAQAIAQHITQPMSREEYAEAERKIDKRADTALQHCKSLEGDAKSHCMTKARGDQHVAQAILLAQYHPSANNSFKALAADVEQRYQLALEACKPAPHSWMDKVAKAEHQACRNKAKAARAQGLHDAHQQAAGLAAVSRPPKSEAERQREADLDTAIRKCDSLLGDANLQCMRDLSPAARQRALERASGIAPRKE